MLLQLLICEGFAEFIKALHVTIFQRNLASGLLYSSLRFIIAEILWWGFFTTETWKFRIKLWILYFHVVTEGVDACGTWMFVMFLLDYLFVYLFIISAKFVDYFFDNLFGIWFCAPLNFLWCFLFEYESYITLHRLHYICMLDSGLT